MKKLSILFPLLAVAFTACNKTGGEQGKVVSPLPDNQVVMKFNGGTITAKDVNPVISSRLNKFNEDAIDLYQQGAERMLTQKLVEAEAKKTGVTAQELIARQAAPAVISDNDVTKFMKDNNLTKGYKDPRTGKTRPVSKEEVRGFLEQQSRQKAQSDFVQKLIATANPQFMIEEARASFADNSDSPFKGATNAKVVIQEFSDFQCPFCSKATEVVGEISKAYGDKVKIVYRNFPLVDIHPQAKPAAEAAVCANKQGKFWPMHDKIFASNHDISATNLEKWAQESGVDMTKFKSCLQNHESEKDIQRDVAEAERVGVNSTPTFFVNGKKVPGGALPFPRFKGLIDAEFARKQ